MKIENCVAIVVVSFNRADVTCLMLQSLALVKTGVPFDVFLIDNKSMDNELVSIKNYFHDLLGQGRLTGEFIESSENLGFSGGNNIGIKKALSNSKYSHICLLNNDTIVTDFWLDRLLGHNVLGLIGPISNSVGNEQIIPTFYKMNGVDKKTIDNVLVFSQQWYQTHQGQLVETDMLGFFCVLGPRSTFEQVGLLDEGFGIGTFEDDDYCVRIKQKKLPIKIARDVFVHHWGSATFSKMGQVRLGRLMKKNRSYYEAKHKKIWAGYSTTLVDALCFEANWLMKAGAAGVKITTPGTSVNTDLSQMDLSKQAYLQYQVILKNYIGSLYSQVEAIQNASFLQMCVLVIRQNATLNIYIKGMLLFVIHALQALMKDQQGKADLKALLKSAFRKR